MLIGYFLDVDGWDSYNFCDSAHEDSPFFSTSIQGKYFMVILVLNLILITNLLFLMRLASQLSGVFYYRYAVVHSGYSKRFPLMTPREG